MYFTYWWCCQGNSGIDGENGEVGLRGFYGEAGDPGRQGEPGVTECISIKPFEIKLITSCYDRTILCETAKWNII